MNKLYKYFIAVTAFIAVTMISGCASSRSDLHMAFKGEIKRNPNSTPVSVFFIFSHVRQTVGLDAIPKLENKFERLRAFDDIFLEAQRELSNLGKYSTYTEESSDVNDPAKRNMRDSLMKCMDYTVKTRIESKKNFANYFLGYLVSTASLTAIPIPYTRHYTIKADVLTSDNRLVASYERQAELTNWSQIFLVVVYPFHPELRKIEEIYMDFLRDVFKQIESEGVLKKG